MSAHISGIYHSPLRKTNIKQVLKSPSEELTLTLIPMTDCPFLLLRPCVFYRGDKEGKTLQLSVRKFTEALHFQLDDGARILHS